MGWFKSWRRERASTKKRAASSIWDEYRRLVEPSQLFDPEWYLRTYPEAAASQLHPFDHYILEGWKKGNSPGPLFDAAWYLSYYRDVASAGLEPLLHYLLSGRDIGYQINRREVAFVDRFENLGDNCEFGLVQIRLGGRRIGLFRFAWTNIDDLITALNSRFAGFDIPENLAIREKITSDDISSLESSVEGYGFSWHVPKPNYEFEWLAAQDDKNICLAQAQEREARRLGLLARKLRDDLEDGERVFVFKSAPEASRERVEDLVRAMRAYGAVTLLWVTLESPDRPAGTVERLGEGLLRAAIDRFAPYEDANDFSFESWKEICRRANEFWLQSRQEGEDA